MTIASSRNPQQPDDKMRQKPNQPDTPDTEPASPATGGKAKGKGFGQGQHVVDDTLLDLKRRVTMAALDPEIFPEISTPTKKAYLLALAECGNRERAATAAGVHRTTPYTPAWRDDEAFQAALEVAIQCAADVLEDEAYRRAVKGVDEPVGWYKGKAGGMIRRYSDTLAIFLLKGLKPERYADRVELRGALANLDLSKLPDHLIERIAAGEHPPSVLASAQPDQVQYLPAGNGTEDGPE